MEGMELPAVRRVAGVAVFCMLLAAAGQASENEVHKIAEAVDHHYNHLESLQTTFSESYQGAGISRLESGTLWLKRPGKMRWEYHQPREKLFVSDGKTAWFYVPGDQQARKTPAKKLDDLRSPLRYLLGKTRLEKEFAGLSLAPDAVPSEPGDVVLRGVPKNMADRVAQVWLEITPQHRIRRVVIEEVDGAVTEFRFREPQENVSITDERFRFRPPPGVETIETEDLAP
jgi:outer membrane lipoprotein carrier protein